MGQERGIRVSAYVQKGPFLALLMWKASSATLALELSVFVKSALFELLNSPSSSKCCEGSAEPPWQILRPRPADHLAPPSTPGSSRPSTRSTAGSCFCAWRQVTS